MSSGTGKDFDHYARDCVKLAEQPNTPSELREQLLQMAREWMQAVMDEEDGTSTSGAGLVSRTPSHCILFSTHTNTLVRASRTRLQSTDAPEMRRQLSPAPDKPPHARPQGGARARSETFPAAISLQAVAISHTRVQSRGIQFCQNEWSRLLFAIWLVPGTWPAIS